MLKAKVGHLCSVNQALFSRMTTRRKPATLLQASLRIAQALLALLYVGTGIMKLMTPVATLAAMWPWAGEYPNLLRFTGIIDLAGGIGIVLPTLTRIKPGLAALAALGLAALQLCAIVFHVFRGEAANTPFNFIMLALALFVFWGRRPKALATTN
jgi:hypothetical protein